MADTVIIEDPGTVVEKLLSEAAWRRAREPVTAVTKKKERIKDWCAACGAVARGEYAIHRDGFGEGPEVPLCNGCGSKPNPTCEQLWAAIAARRALGLVP